MRRSSIARCTSYCKIDMTHLTVHTYTNSHFKLLTEVCFFSLEPSSVTGPSWTRTATRTSGSPFVEPSCQSVPPEVTSRSSRVARLASAPKGDAVMNSSRRAQDGRTDNSSVTASGEKSMDPVWSRWEVDRRPPPSATTTANKIRSAHAPICLSSSGPYPTCFYRVTSAWSKQRWTNTRRCSIPVAMTT